MKRMQDPKTPVDRRDFIKGAATGVAALVTAAPVAQAAPAAAAQTPTPAAPSTAESGRKKYASDFMVDLFRAMNMEYMFAMCASSFIGIHESIINYAGNRNPESITCT